MQKNSPWNGTTATLPGVVPWQPRNIAQQAEPPVYSWQDNGSFPFVPIAQQGQEALNDSLYGKCPAKCRTFFIWKMNRETEWIQKLISEDNVHAFYTSKHWRRMQKQVLKDNHWECQRCKKKGLVVTATTVHHKQYLRQHPELALEKENLEAICEKCHYEEHHKKKDKYTNEERW